MSLLRKKSLDALMSQAGDSEKGLAALSEILKIDSSAGALNNVAFDLAEANARLPEARGNHVNR